jgi:hypothetical protein
MREKFKVVILTEGQAMKTRKAHEVARILRKLAERIEETGDVCERDLYDSTGEKVGTSGLVDEY